MPDLHPDFLAALEESVIRPAWFIFVDIDGQQLRLTSAGYNVTFGVEEDEDVSEQTFEAISAAVLDVGTVVHRQGGSETVQVTLSGMLNLDQEVLDAIGDRTKWQGRVVRLWMGVRDEEGEFQGTVAPYYTGYMLSLKVSPSPEQQTISLQVENYLSLLSEAANRTWLDQKVYDPTDTSAAASIGTANGAAGLGAQSGFGVGGSGGGASNGRVLSQMSHV